MKSETIKIEEISKEIVLFKRVILLDMDSEFEKQPLTKLSAIQIIIKSMKIILEQD